VRRRTNHSTKSVAPPHEGVFMRVRSLVMKWGWGGKSKDHSLSEEEEHLDAEGEKKKGR